MKKTLITLSFVMATVACYAQVSIVANLFTTPDTTSHPSWFTVFNNNLYFLANPDAYTMNMYKVTGLGSPVSLGPAVTSSAAYYYADELNNSMTECNGRLYFPGGSAMSSPKALWSSDGISAPAPVASSGVRYLASALGKVYFSTGVTGDKLKRYDPATLMTSDVSAASGILTVRELTEANDKIYFRGDTILYYYEPTGDTVHRVSTTANWPQEVTAIDNGFGSSFVFFTAKNGATGRELYVYAEQNAPFMVTDLFAGPNDGVPSTSLLSYYTARRQINALNNKVYFTGNNGTTIGLFQYDPITNATTLATTLLMYPIDLTINQNKLYFIAHTSGLGDFLYRYDGVNAPVMVADVFPGSTQDMLNELTSYQGILYFSAGTGDNSEPYRFHDSTTSIQQMSFHADVSLYPNPATDVVKLSIKLEESQSLTIQLTDLSGKSLSTEKKTFTAGANVVSMIVSSFAAGVHICSIKNDKGDVLYSTRLMKK